jgi:hypothetical protein
MYFLTSILLGAIVHGSVTIYSGAIDRDSIRWLVAVGAWVLLARLLRTKIRQPSIQLVLAASIVLGAAWTALHFAVSMVEALRVVAELAKRSPTPVDVRLELGAWLQILGVALATSVAGGFVLRALPGKAMPPPTLPPPA